MMESFIQMLLVYFAFLAFCFSAMVAQELRDVDEHFLDI